MFIGRTDTEAEAEAPTLWPPDVKNQPTERDPDAGKDWGQVEKGRQRMRWLDSITDSIDMNFSKLQQTMKDRGAWCAAVHGVAKSWTLPRRWTSVTYLAVLRKKTSLEHWSVSSNRSSSHTEPLNKVSIVNALHLITVMPLCTRNHQEVNTATVETLAHVVLNLRNKSQNNITSLHFSQQKNSEKKELIMFQGTEGDCLPSWANTQDVKRGRSQRPCFPFLASWMLPIFRLVSLWIAQ